jgi:hypothetical protein
MDVRVNSMLFALTVIVFLRLGCFVAYIKQQRQTVDHSSKHANNCCGDSISVILSMRRKPPVSGKNRRLEYSETYTGKFVGSV